MRNFLMSTCFTRAVQSPPVMDHLEGRAMEMIIELNFYVMEVDMLYLIVFAAIVRDARSNVVVLAGC